MSPVEIKRLDHSLEIVWSDQAKTIISSETLRKNCPCAECREKRGDTSHAEPLTPKKSLLKVIEHTKQEELKLVKIWAVGQYALGMEWGDGHATGIYTYELLHQL